MVSPYFPVHTYMEVHSQTAFVKKPVVYFVFSASLVDSMRGVALDSSTTSIDAFLDELDRYKTAGIKVVGSLPLFTRQRRAVNVNLENSEPFTVEIHRFALSEYLKQSKRTA